MKNIFTIFNMHFEHLQSMAESIVLSYDHAILQEDEKNSKTWKVWAHGFFTRDNPHDFQCYASFIRTIAIESNKSRLMENTKREIICGSMLISLLIIQRRHNHNLDALKKCALGGFIIRLFKIDKYNDIPNNNKKTFFDSLHKYIEDNQSITWNQNFTNQELLSFINEERQAQGSNNKYATIINNYDLLPNAKA